MLNTVATTKRSIVRIVILGLLSVSILSCVNSPPQNQDNICSIFEEKSGWYKKAKKATKRWGVPIATNMAIMHQESRFVSTAKPGRKKILGLIPGPRKSSSYGYSQAKNETWEWYIEKAGNWRAERSDFADAIDFIAWYGSISVSKNKIKHNDTYHLYLAYHEGHGGFDRRSFKNKKWLKDVASKVNRRAARYQSQLAKCEKKLSKGWW